jgi:hypothetical protein
MNETPAARPSLGRRAIALLILVVVGWLLLHLVIHIALVIATVVVVVLAIAGVLWAAKTLF